MQKYTCGKLRLVWDEPEPSFGSELPLAVGRILPIDLSEDL